MLLALRVSLGAAAFNCSVKARETPLRLAVTVTVWAELTAETFAENAALVEPAGTVTEPGTTTAVELLERLTAIPPLDAAELSVTVQATVPEPVMDELAQERALSAGWAGFNCTVKAAETPPATAVRVAACVELTAEAVAEKPALVEPAGTVTDAGTVRDVLLLLSVTMAPPLGAAAFSVTVQALLPAPVMEELAHERVLGTGIPVPLRLRLADGLVEEVLLTASWPLAAPLALGLNCTVRVAVWPGFRASGTVIPEMEKPAPVRASEFTVTAAVPLDERTSD